MLPDEPNEEERLEKLPEDGETPFRPAYAKTDDTYPSLDTGQQPEELYDEGAPIKEPNAGNAVTGYDASKDQRLNDKT